MKPTEKIANDLFQSLRTRFSPINIGDENAEVTTDPSAARFFSFVYEENGKKMGPVSISIITNRSLKVYYSHSMVKELQKSQDWYNFLKEMRFFSKQNLLAFDARDIQKDQLDTRDFEFIKTNDGPYKEEDVEITESAMFGSKRKSMQKFENATLVVYHKKTVDEEKRGARSRHIDSIFIESNHERFRFPINYLNGARAMAVHVSEGGTPYDAIGQHIITTVVEMQNLAKFARMTRRHAMEDSEAETIRNRVVETYSTIKKDIMRMQNVNNYRAFAETFEPTEASGEADVSSLQEKFTRKIWNEQMTDLLPSVQRALEAKVDEADIDENAFNQAAAAAARAGKPEFEFNGKTYKTKMDKDTAHKLDEASPSVEKTIKDPNFVLLLKKDENADRMIRTTKFRKADGLLAFIMSDIASRMIGDGADAVANFASQMAIDIGEEGASFGTKMTPEYKRDKQLATMLAQKYLGDIKRMATDADYADTVRKDPADVYGKKKKRDGSYHEAVQAFESWANDLYEAVTTGTVGTTGTTGTSAARTNAQVVKALSGGDPAKARDIKRVSDKLARGQKLTPAEMPVAGEIAKNVMTTKKPNAAMQALAQDEHTDMEQTKYDGHDIMSEDPPNGIDFDYNNLPKVNWSQYSQEDIRLFYRIVDNLDFEDGYYNEPGKTGSHWKALKWLEDNVLSKDEDFVVEKTLKVKADKDEDFDDDDTRMGSITVKSDDERKKRAQMYRDKMKSEEVEEELEESTDNELDLIQDSLALLKKFAGI